MVSTGKKFLIFHRLGIGIKSSSPLAREELWRRTGIYVVNMGCDFGDGYGWF